MVSSLQSKTFTEPFHSFCSAGTNWTIEYPTCGGSSQSPINIDSDTVVMADYSNFSISIGYKVVQKGPLQNDGHTCKTQKLLTTYMMNKKYVHLFQWNSLLTSPMGPKFLAGPWPMHMCSTSFIFIGEARQTRVLNICWMIKGKTNKNIWWLKSALRLSIIHLFQFRCRAAPGSL